MKFKIKAKYVYVIKAPQETRGEEVIGYTPAEKALGWENKTSEEIDALIAHMTEGIHDGLKSVYNEGAGKDGIEQEVQDET